MSAELTTHPSRERTTSDRDAPFDGVPNGRLVFGIFASIAEFERELRGKNPVATAPASIDLAMID